MLGLAYGQASLQEQQSSLTSNFFEQVSENSNLFQVKEFSFVVQSQLTQLLLGERQNYFAQNPAKPYDPIYEDFYNLGVTDQSDASYSASQPYLNKWKLTIDYVYLETTANLVQDYTAKATPSGSALIGALPRYGLFTTATQFFGAQYTVLQNMVAKLNTFGGKGVSNCVQNANGNGIDCDCSQGLDAFPNLVFVFHGSKTAYPIQAK